MKKKMQANSLNKLIETSRWDQFPLPKIPLLLYFPNLFFPFIFPLLYLPSFPFSFLSSLFSCLVTILSRFSKTTGSRVGELTSLHLHPCSYIMSPTDHPILIYLTIFCNSGFTGSSFHLPGTAISILHPKTHDIHYDHQVCHG